MTKKNEVKNIDVTKSGPMTFRQLQEANSQPYNGVSQEFLSFSQSVEAATAPTSLYDARAHSEQLVESPLANQPTRWGESMFDAATATEAQFQNLGDMRAENQPWYAKIGAGIGKAVVYAGTTFANGTAGLLYGLGKWAAGGNFSDVWNNEVTVTMDDIMKASELSMPNYRTQYEQEHPMALENIFSANFLGDSIIKNIGFLVGAYYSGGIFSKGAGLLLRAVGASRGVTSSTAQLVGGFMSAANEGGIESLNAANEFEEESMANLEQIHQARLQQIQEKYLQNRGKKFVNTGSGDGNQLTDEAYLTMQQELAEAQRDYEAAQVKIQEDKARVGNVTFGLNLAILTPSNIAQFGRLYSRGFNTSRRMLNNTRRLADGTFEVTNKTKLGKAYTIAKGGVWEGTEEVLQQGASDVSQHHYYNDVFDYYKALLDDKENYQTQSWMQSVQESLYQTLGSESTWEQFLSGTIMGLMGMPGFRKAKDKNGNWQSPITLEGNAWSRYREMSEEQSRAENIVNYLNNRINSSGDFNAYYQGLLRRNKIDKDMIDAAENGDQFGYKNSEFAQLISDIEMFNSVGRSEDLISMINQALDTSDSNIESIIKNTTRITEDGKLDGPFAQYALANEDGTISVNFGSEQSKQEVKNLLTNKIEDVINTVNSYSSTRKEIDNVTNYALSDDQLNYLTYMSTQLDNWKQRAKEMAGDVKGGISGVVSTLEENLRLFEQLRDAEGQKGKGDLTEAYKKYDKSVKEHESLISLLNPLRESSDGLLATNLTQNRKFTDSLIDVLQQIPSQTLDEVKKQDLIAKLQDLSKVGKASELFNKKFEEFIKNPDKLNQEQEEVREQVQEEQAEQKSNDLKALLNNAKSLQEFRQILDQQEDQDTIDRTLKELRESGHEMAKKYQETSEYRNNVMKALDEANLDLQTKQDALKLLQDQFDNTEDLSQIANPNSIYINNDAAFDEDSDSVEQSQTRFQNARYALQNALIKVNKDNKFKDRFSNEYTTPKDQKQQGSKESKESQQKPPVEAPVGDITFDSVQNENKQANQEELQNPASKERQQYYRPAIPEVHIEASREGDFRDFNLVAKSELGQFHYLRAKKLNDEENALIDEYIKAHPNEPRNIQLIRNALKEKLDRGNQYLEGVLASPLPNFDTIYEYFVKNGTFEYLNQGLLHVGDEIAFMIDPEFEETIKNEPWHTGPVIFMINKKDGHVVGSLDSAASSLSGYEGLRTLEQRIIQEYTNRKSSQSKERFIATPTTRVSKIMEGKIPYTNEERSLQNIPNINDGKGPIFGIIKNGVLTTNYALDDSLVIKPADMRNKEGRLYLLIPNGTGKYSPVAVRVKHFNKEEFNIENVDDASTKVGQAIKDAIEQLSKATSEEDVKDAVKILTKYIYLQDVHFNWFEAKAGSGIVIRRDLREADGSYKKTIINGEEHIESWHDSIYYTTRKGSVIRGGLEFWSEVVNKFGAQQEEQALKDPSQIYKEILDILAGFNLPMQVSAREINGGTYNQDRINSGILTSNLEKASTVGTWFTTDYFNDNGELQPAVNPASKARHPVQDKTNPVGGTNNAINGTPIQLGNTLYYVDSNTGNIYDKNGKAIEDSQYKELLFDLAWAQNLFGNAKNSAVMVDNKVITPNDKVLDRTTQTYLTGNEAQKVRDAIEGKKQEQTAKVDKSEQIVGKIQQDQQRVDKSKTDNEYYYILEDDGKYHKYERVHKRLGNQFTQDDSKQEDSSQSKELLAGSSVDYIIRAYFTTSDVSTIERPSNVSEQAFRELLDYLSTIKESMESRGERFLTNNIVLFKKYEDGTRIAGEVDILSVDKYGNFRIYDVKTSKYSFRSHNGLNLFDWTIDGKPATREEIQSYIQNNFKNPFALKSNMSTKDYYTLQLSAYKNLFESAYGAQVSSLGILPFVLNYSGDNISSIFKEQGILVTHNPAVSVPLVRSTNPQQEAQPRQETQPVSPIMQQSEQTLPILDRRLDNQDSQEFELHPPIKGENTQVYFELNGKLYKSTAAPFIKVNGIQLYIDRERNSYSEQGGQVSAENYYVIFPNGKVFTLARNQKVSEELSIQELRDKYASMFEKKPDKVIALSQEETLVTKALNSIKQDSAEQVRDQALSKESETAQKLKEVDNKKVSRKRRPSKPSSEEKRLRRSTDSANKIWDKEKELAWLNKVLPQLSEEDRIKLVSGLVHVAEQGIDAYGLFDGSVIVLSDIAAEGTTYHEAFHAVFKLLLDNNERASLLKEYSSKHPNMDNISLEEELAEDFREFVMQGGKDTRSLGRKIIDFFKSLFIKTKYWKDFRPSSLYYFKKINDGKYAERVLKSNTILANDGDKLNDMSVTRYMREEYTQEMQDILAKAPRDSQGRLLAPNGEVSNLTEKQYAQVRTKAFKDWFGDWENYPANASKVVDENSEPLVVYHESPNIFNTFDISKKRFNVHNVNGIWASAINRKGKGYGENIYPLFINLRNPINTSIKQVKSVIELRDLENKALNDANSDGAILDTIDKFGYEIQYYVKSPNQVKSATNNIGTFDANNPDIRYRTVPNSSFESLKAEDRETLLKKGWTEKTFNSISQEERDNVLNCIAF